MHLSGGRFVRIVVRFALWAMCALASSEAQSVVLNEVVSNASDRVLVREAGTYPHVGNTVPWQAAEYDDSRWPTGTGGFGFGTFAGVTVGTSVAGALQNRVPSLYLRKRFNVTAPQAASTDVLQLLTRYNDGFIVFINGVEVARRNMGNPGMFAYHDQTAFNARTSVDQSTIDLGAANALLVEGENILAVQAHNSALIGVGAAEFLFEGDLEIQGGGSLVAHTDVWSYLPGFAEPSGGLIDYGLLDALIGEVPLVAWGRLSFNDGTWTVSAGPVGSDDTADFGLGTNLYSETFAITPSIYTRKVFSVSAAEAAAPDLLQLTLDYDDGVIVYLNGREIARRNLGAPGEPVAFSALAGGPHDANGDEGGTVAGQEEVILLAPASELLQPGDNVLAVQLHRNALIDPDAIVRTTLETTGTGARTLVAPTDSVRFFIGLSEPVVATGAEEDTVIAEEDFDSENDWIELKNLTAATVDLSGWALTDDDGALQKWTFPSGTSIGPGGFLVVMASGLNIGPVDGADYLHTNFGVSSKGEYLALVDAGGAIAHQIAPMVPAQTPLYSYARADDGSFAFRTTATPGGENDPVALAPQLPAPGFSVPGGFHPASLLLTLTTTVGGSSLRYTLDGSEPTLANGTTYTSPLAISDNTIVRARVFLPGAIPSVTVTHSYLIDESAARQSLAVIALGGDPALTYFGPNTNHGSGPPAGEGIFAIKGGDYDVDDNWSNEGDEGAFNTPMQRGRALEKRATFEFIPLEGAPLRTELGVRIAGSDYSRPKYQLTDPEDAAFTINPASKPSLNLFFRSDFGGDRPVHYPFFPGSQFNDFNDIRVRAGKNDISNPFLLDEWVRRLFIATGQEGSRGIFANVYLNGTYKGYYNLCERLREGFMQEHYGSSATWDVQQVNEFSSGDPVHWNSMIAYLRTSDLATLPGYAGVGDYLEVDNLIDYLLVNIFGAVRDWPTNNWVASHERTPEGRWRFHVWDAEVSFGLYGDPVSYNIITESLTLPGNEALSTSTNYIAAMFTLLLNSPEFKLRFADRVQKQFFDNGALTTPAITAIYNELRDAINPIMQETIGQSVNSAAFNNWIAGDQRRIEVLAQLTAAGLWTAVLAPELSLHGGELDPADTVSITNPNPDGVIYYTLDGTDPRAPGGAIAGAAYAVPIAFATAGPLRARVRTTAGAWSPEVAVAFTLAVDEPLFLPTGSASWNADVNWSSAEFPDGAASHARIGPPGAGNRNVDLDAPVTVGVLRFSQDASIVRNRVRGVSALNGLTFDNAPDPALIEVGGTGVGYVEFEIIGGVVLSSDLELKVDNIVGDPEHGALRLRQGWSGAGGIHKTGLGTASLSGENKLFTGPVLVDEGVLIVSQPASPSLSSSITVNPDGQLRLSSGGVGEIRSYAFGGPLHVSGQGRGAAIPDNAQFGKLGALRYDPDPSGANHARLTTTLDIAAAADVHVDGPLNLLEFTGSITGNDVMSKSGGGTLRISAASPGFVNAIVVNNGRLEVNQTIGSPITLAASGVLSGSGQCGVIDGGGAVIQDGRILLAGGAVGASHSFVFRQFGNPVYGTATASGNGVLRIPSGLLQTDAIDLYLDAGVLDATSILRGGFFVPTATDLASVLAGATVRVFDRDVAGAHAFSGVQWTLLPAAIVIPVETTADFGAGVVNGQTLEVRFAKAAASVTLGNLAQTYNGTPRSATASTVPAGLPVSLTYNGAPGAPVDAGIHPVVAAIVSPSYEGTASGNLTITVGIPTTYDAWVQLAFPIPADRHDPAVSGADIDLDGDGRTGLMEYATGGDPFVAEPSVVEFLWVEDAGQMYGALRFIRRIQATDLTYTLRGRDALSEVWDNITTTPFSITPIDAEFEEIVLRDVAEETSLSMRYLQLLVTQN